MFSRVLVGDDGRSGGRDAAALAEQLADPSTHPELAHVHPPVGSELHRVAHSRSVDLLVVGSASHPRAGVALPSDHARAALNGAPCAVAIAPIGYATHPGQIATIGVADNGSPESTTALAAARELAARDGLTITALSVVDLPSLEPTPVATDAALRARLDAERDRLAAADGVDGEAVYGDVGKALVEFSEQVDLLLVGSRGHGPVGRLFLGSTSNYLARHARCPLLVLPRAGHQGQWGDALGGPGKRDRSDPRVSDCPPHQDACRVRSHACH
jgi:nucleotide-binding universal stress UspA family protein